MITPPPISTLFPYTTLFRSRLARELHRRVSGAPSSGRALGTGGQADPPRRGDPCSRSEIRPRRRTRETRGRDSDARADRKSTRLNSSHITISYAVFCLKKKK